jgi:cation diffusion facilitator CzcD-associated flavoprotein CzcO
MTKTAIAIIGAGPYGLSVAAHLGARNIEHRIFGRPMQFWSNVASAASERYLKSFCFATNISTPTPGFEFVDYNRPRGLETYEPCPIGNFAAYGQWFQQNIVPWVEPVDVSHVGPNSSTSLDQGFVVTLVNGERINADHIVIATGLSYFSNVPSVLKSLPAELATHTSKITSFASFKGSSVAVIGAGQSALEAAALLHEAGADAQLLVREKEVHWNTRTPRDRNLWQRIRKPVSGLGTGPKAWALINFPGALNRAPDAVRNHVLKGHVTADGAWWLRERVENRTAVHVCSTVVEAHEENGKAALKIKVSRDESTRLVKVDHVIAGSGYSIDVDRLDFLDEKLRAAVDRIDHAPRLNAEFQSSVPGLHFVGPTSVQSFGPLFRFVVGAEYTAQTVSGHFARRVSSQLVSQALSAA